MPILRNNTNGADEMEALYEDESTEGAAPAEEAGAAPATAELDSAVLEGQTVKPGDKVILEVVSVGDGTVRVKYASEGAEEPEMSEDDQLAQLAG